MNKQNELAELKKLSELISERDDLESRIQEEEKNKRDRKTDLSMRLLCRENEIKGMAEAKFPAFDGEKNIPEIYSVKWKIQPQEPKSSYSKRMIAVLVVSAIFTIAFFRTLILALMGQVENNFLTSVIFLLGSPALGGLCFSLYHIFVNSEKKAYLKQCEEYAEVEKRLNKLQLGYQEEARRKIKAHTEQLEAYEEKYKAAVVEHMRSLARYQEGMDELPRFKADMTARYNREAQAYDRKITALQEELSVCEQKLEQMDVLHSSEWGYLEDVIRLMETGRADTCKEALNMAIEIEERRRHNQEMERIAREKADETERHNREMERQARAEQEWAEMEALHARVKQEERERSMERDAKRAEIEKREKARRQCEGCAKYHKCRNREVYGCGAFVPRY